MIIGIGIDSVEVDRFALWYTYSEKKLLRIFSLQEINYCLQEKGKSSERFAARFASREAFFKALSHAYPLHKIPFLTLCSYISVEKKNMHPQLIINWKSICHKHKNDELKDLCISSTVHLSLTHTKTVASAIVVIEKRSD